MIMWYVLQVKTGEELKVRDRLHTMNFTSHVPRENRMLRKGGGWAAKEYTLFPSYVFVELAYTAENYYKIKDIPWVIKFLGYGANPSCLSYLEAEWIKALSFGGLPIEATKVRIAEDGKAELVEGILLNFSNRLLTIDKHKHRATFEITVCGEPKKIELSIEII